TLHHRNRRDQLNRQLNVVAGHHHLRPLRQRHDTRNVRRPEVELRTIVLEERRMTTALLLRQDVRLSLKLLVRLHRARLAKNLTTLNSVLVNAAQQAANVVASLALIQQLAEHLNAGHNRLLRIAQTNDLDLVANLDHAALNTTRHNRTATRDREHV